VLTGALGTYAAAIVVVAASLGIGAGVCAASGASRWTWAAPAVGLGGATVLAWWAVRLPGEGLTALIVLGVATVAGGAIAAMRMEGLGAAAVRGAPALLAMAAAVSIPFAVEGHFGILGTGFNVDMSQHLFTASWLADQSGAAPGLYEQGYPLGPHALAVGTGEISGELATAFSGVTIAIPVLVALTALGFAEAIPRWRAALVAVLAGVAYLAASYLAQGSFKELFEAAFVVGFALWLAEVSRGRLEAGWRLGLAPAVIAAGALYAYSGPGLAWLAGTLVLWGLAELTIGRKGTDTVPDPPMTLARSALPALLVGVVALVLLVAPELDRITDFGGSVGTVSEKAEADEDSQPAGSGGGGNREMGPKFDNDLGNLFGQINPLTALGVWPSGDFRVEPGDGAIPAPVFYLGALLGAMALGVGLRSAWRRGETALLAALAVAAAIWVAARIGSTPYTAAKALMLIAPVAMLISARGLLDPGFLADLRSRPAMLRAALATAFVSAAAFSSALALANAPVGPREYSPGVTALADEFAGRSVLLLVDDDVLADEHGEEFYGWELREAGSFEIRPLPEGPVGGFDYVLAITNTGEPPAVVSGPGDFTIERAGARK